MSTTAHSAAERRESSVPQIPSRALTAAEVARLYAGRTWMWKSGGGYFAPNGTFLGAVGSTASDAFIARGSWTANNRGELCFSAVWQGQTGMNDERTCFRHQMQGGEIWQQKGETGSLYVFRSAPTKSTDEFAKLMVGDRVSSKVSELRGRFLYGLMF